ncbi:MAG: type VI secretion system baseplate subunit TssG [Alphaproteobacteria bacterium]|nr:MAG: type VI secretion system baseplate subunit TssG [Alphaproteobacteria bacterium]
MRVLPKALVDELITTPYAFSFHQVMRLLNAWRSSKTDKSLEGQKPVQPLRIGGHVHLNWPPGDIFFVDIPKDIHSPIRLNVNFMGLAGVQGPLPLPITELILKRRRAGDFVFQDFLDIFHNRLLHLLHDVARKRHVMLNTKRPHETAMGKAFLAIAGLGETESRNRMAFPDRALPFYAGLLWQNPRNISGLIQLLIHYFSIPVTVQTSVGRWVSIDSSQQTRLGRKCGQLNRLGDTAVLGQRAWQQDYYVDVVMSTMSHAMYESLIPSGHGFLHLQDLCHLYIHKRCSVRVKLTLPEEERQTMRVDGTASLGWTTYLSGKSKRPNDRGAQYILTRITTNS